MSVSAQTAVDGVLYAQKSFLLIIMTLGCCGWEPDTADPVLTGLPSSKDDGVS